MVVLACLDPSEDSSHKASAFRCSALSSSALRSSARDRARLRRAGRQSGPAQSSAPSPAGKQKDTIPGSLLTQTFFNPSKCFKYIM